jgi:hypothetical protein
LEALNIELDPGMCDKLPLLERLTQYAQQTSKPMLA